MTDSSQKKTGVILGGSGLIGGAITHYFKTLTTGNYELLAPNSKKLSLRVPEDIKQYLTKLKPDFIINTAIAAIDSDPLLSFETNYLGSLNLAKASISLGIPYIHFSSAATMPNGNNLPEEEQIQLSADLPNYSKSKLMTELTLQHMAKTMGLDFTIIRLAVVYGKHDHKIQGFHRLLFSIVDQAMPALLTKRNVRHSYTNTKKIPPFVHYILENRQEFSGQTYNFADPDPVVLPKIILTTKSYLQLSTPKEIYIPYRISKFIQLWLSWTMKKLSRIGIEARMPAELQFLENFYNSQTLSVEKLAKSSYGLPQKETTVFSELPALIEYYLTRWEQLNLVSLNTDDFFDPKKRAEDFLRCPTELLSDIHLQMDEYVDNYNNIRSATKQENSST